VASVEDLGSRNGTQINETTITKRTKLRSGDILRVGPMLFEFEVKVKSAVVGNQKSPTETEIESETDEVVVKESTEDSIVNWLAEDEPAAADTDTVIGRTAPTTEHPAADPALSDEVPNTPHEPVSANVPAPAKKEFASVAEEAQDIIRRHLEMKSRDE